MSIETNDMPSIAQIEKLLRSIQPTPGAHFHQRMAQAPWKITPSPTEGAFKMNRKHRFAGIALLVLVGVVALAATPAGKALANEILQFFERAQGNTLPLPPDQILPPVASATPEPTYALPLQPAEQVTRAVETATPAPTPALDADQLQDMDLSAARQYAGFELYQPASLPVDYRLTRILYDSQQQAVSMQYASPQTVGEFFQITQGKNLKPFTVGADAPVETVSIGDYSAEFVRGGWFVANGASESTWENDANVFTLRWQAGEITLSIKFLMNESFSPAYLDREQMLEVARSLVVCDPADPASLYACEVGQAAAAAGFTPWQFPTVPAGLTFQYVDYRPNQTVLWYSSSDGAFSVLQSGQDFAAQEESPWLSVPAEAVQSVTIAGQPGEYVKGEFIAPVGKDQAIWNPDSPLERLRWKNGGWWFQITKWGQPALTPQQLADLAGQLTGDSAQVQAERQQSDLQESGPWADVFSSVADVETAAGHDVLEPGVLPQGLPFSHARYNPSYGSSVMLFYGSFAADKMHANGPVLLIIEEPLRASSGDFSSIYPPEALETVEVNGYPGVLIKGYMETKMSEPGQPTAAPVWNANTQELTLTWKTAERSFAIQFNPAPGNSGARLDLADLIQIAESLH